MELIILDFGRLLVMEYFYIVVLVLLLTSSTTAYNPGTASKKVEQMAAHEGKDHIEVENKGVGQNRIV